MRIYLIGYMGCGKSTVGKKLAAKLHLNFVDLDNLIESKYKVTIPQLFQKYDENAFRVIERDCLYETFLLDNVVISTGGGTPCFYDNMDRINQNGISIYLKLHPKSLHSRLVNARKKRPLIDQKSNEEILVFIEEQLKLRKPYYNMASMIIKGEDVDIKLLANQLNLINRNLLNN